MTPNPPNPSATRLAPVSPELLDRLPPQDLAAEKAVLASLILDGKRVDDVADLLRPEDFYGIAHGKIYAVLLGMQNRDEKIDLRLLAAQLQRSGDMAAIGGERYLYEVMQEIAVPHHAAYYAKIVADKAQYRRLIHAGLELVRAGYAEEEKPEAVIDATEATLAGVIGSHREDEPVSISDAAMQAMARIETAMERKQSMGVLTGLEAFDSAIGGLFGGELCILAARPGIGKTALATQIAFHCGRKGRLTLMASLEMSAAELATRILTGRARVSSRKVRTASMERADLSAIMEAGADFSEAALYVYDNTEATVPMIRRRARQLARKGLALLVVDYLQLIDATPENSKRARYEIVGGNAKQLRAIARVLNIPVLCLCQVSRDAEKERMSMRHLRESGDIENHADVIVFLEVEEEVPGMKPEQQARLTADEVAMYPRRAKLSIQKNRNGEKGDVPLTWIPYRTMFTCDPIAMDFNGVAIHFSEAEDF